MKIVCPSCAATYEVPESAVTSKRAVRCARCGGDWVPGAPDAPHTTPPESAAPPPAEIAADPLAPPVVAEIPDIEQMPAPPEPDPEPLSIVPEVEGPFIAAPSVAPLTTPSAKLAQNLAAAIAAEAATSPPAVPKPPMTAWIASLALLAILLLASVAFREPVMKAWPASTRLYAVLGLYRP